MEVISLKCKADWENETTEIKKVGNIEYRKETGTNNYLLRQIVTGEYTRRDKDFLAAMYLIGKEIVEKP